MTAPADTAGNPDRPATVEVVLVELPLQLRAKSAAHSAELLREMELMSIGRETGTTKAVPLRLLQLAAEMRDVYGPFIDAVDEELDAATDRGDVTVDEVRYVLPVDMLQFILRIVELLDELEEFCRQGKHLLLLAAPDDVTAYRDWSIQEVIRQMDGHPPTPWSAYVAAGG